MRRCFGEGGGSRDGFCFFFNETAPTEIYTLSLHDALPIWFLGTKFGATQVLLPNPTARGEGGFFKSKVNQVAGLSKTTRKHWQAHKSDASLAFGPFTKDHFEWPVETQPVEKVLFLI